MKNTIQTKTPTNLKDYWRTSDQAYRDACALIGIKCFDIDVAADAINSKCHDFLHEGDNSLSCDWFASIECTHAWCNPPFSRKVEFLQKAYEQRIGGLICMMLPYEPCTKWWRDNVDGKASIVYVPDGRYFFHHPETNKGMPGVNFASAFVVFTSLAMPTQYVHFERGVGDAAERELKEDEK